MERDLTIILAERDAIKHKMELEKLRDENLNLMQQIRDKIENAKVEITESAIDKTMSILEKTRLWLIYGSSFFAIFIGIAGFIGYKSVNKEITDYYINTVHHWLRFDSPESGGSRVLNDLRTEALLDSLTLKYEREKVNSGPINNINLNTEERLRLMSLILNPETDEQNYRDALRLITISRGLYGRYYEDDIGKKIASILDNKEFSDSKKIDVINYLSKDRALFPWALAVINDNSPQMHEDFQMKAFQNVKNFSKELAIKFAERNITEFKDISNRIQLGVFLIENGMDNKSINNLISELKITKKETFASDYRELILARIKKGLDDNNKEFLSNYISEKMNDNLRIELSSFLNKKPVLSFSFGDITFPFREPDKLFENNVLIDSIAKEESLTLDRLLKLTQFFQLQDRGYWITTFMFKPAENTEIIFDGNERIKGNEVLQKVWLRAQKKAGAMTLTATMRKKDGEIFESPVLSIRNCDQCHFFVDYDKDQLRNYTWVPDYDYFNY